jgi:hypothetical protein
MIPQSSEGIKPNKREIKVSVEGMDNLFLNTLLALATF